MAARKKEKKLDSWIIGQCFAKREKQGPCQEFRLMHIGVSGTPDGVIESWAVTPEHTEEELKELSDAILQSAEADATGTGHFQKYALMAYFLIDGEMTSMARFTIPMAAGDGEESIDGAGATEPANTQGLLAQTQRHLESVMRMNLQSVGTAVGSLAAMNERLSKQLEGQIDEKLKVAEMISDLLDKRQERDTKREDALVGIGLKQKAAENVLPMLPMLLNKMMGGKMLPEGKSKMKDAMKTFAESLTEEQVLKMMEPLGEAQKMAMMEVLIEIRQPDENAAPSVSDEKPPEGTPPAQA